MSRYTKLILVIGVVVVCAAGAILSLAPAKNVEHDGDADALRTAGDLIQKQGMGSSYSIGAWTNRFDVTLDAALDTSDAAIVAYQVCSEPKIPVHRQWTARFFLADGHKVAECEINR
jgi:hypothetical protein